MAGNTSSIALSVSKKHVICSEILSVTSAMRKNSRWAASAQTPLYARDDALAASMGLRRHGGSSDMLQGSSKQEVLLMANFLELKREVLDAREIENFPLSTLLSPFFALIRSPLSTGPITSAALAAIHTFFVLGFVSPDAPDLEHILAELSSTVSNCKFEASDASGDEVVLYRIMAVIEQCMCGPAGSTLGDVEVCEMLETVLTNCCQMRLSEILRKYAESTMHAVVRQVFSRLYSLDAEEEERKLAALNTDSSENELTMNVQTGQNPPTDAPFTAAQNNLDPSTQQDNATLVEGSTTKKEDKADPSRVPTPVPRSEYGLPSIVELLRVLVKILDPNDRTHTDSTRLTALRILNTAFEVAGSQLGLYPTLMNIIQDEGCKNLFQLARADNPNVLYMSLRVISSMLETMRTHLKLQQELFLSFTIDRLTLSAPTRAQIATMAQQKGLIASPRPGTPYSGTPNASTPTLVEPDEENTGPSRPAILPAKGETRELMLETLSQIARYPGFMVDLFMNYDCDVNCEDLFEKLVSFLTKGVYGLPVAGPRELAQQTSQLLCLDLLLEFINGMCDRANQQEGPWSPDLPSPQEILESKARKRLVLTGASRFNTKPKVGLSFLEENGLIYADLSGTVSRQKSLAKFLKSCARLDKKLLGDYLSRPENIDVLKAFIELFDFKGKPVADALRELLESFRLPGESQQIARITETFAEVYFATGPAEIKSQDAVYILTYSIIMLNTDQHSPQIRKRMTLEDYQRNLRGQNDGEDFSTEFLNNVYESIRKREIVMPEEHTGQVGFGYAWKELLARTRVSGKLYSSNSSAFDFTMFNSVWRSVIAAIAFAFTTFDDDYTVQRAITGFRQVATLAGHFQLPEVLDYVVVSLSQVSSLVPDTLVTRVPHYPVVEVEGQDVQDVTVSSLSIKFGTNFKGQLAAVVLFTIINGNGNAVREGWTQIFEIFTNLFIHSLLPGPMLKAEQFISEIPLHATVPQPRPARGDGGLLSALSSYLMTPYSSSSETIPEATDSEIENTQITIDCINACRLEELYSQIPALSGDALVWAVRALEALAHERTVARLKQEIDDTTAPNSPTPSRKSQPPPQSLSYDPASAFLLEMMVSIITKTPQYIDETWPVVYEHLSALLSSATSYNILLVERAIAGLWRLLLVIADKPALRDQLYVSLDLMGSLPATVTNSVGEQIIAGVVQLVKTRRDIIKSQTEWSLVIALMRQSMKQPAASRQCFDLLTTLVVDGTEQCVTTDNFAGLVGLLDEYASAAGSVVENAGHHDKRKEAETPLFELALQRGKQSVDLLFDLKKFIPRFTESEHVPAEQVWKQCSLPLICALSRQCTNASREIRHTALIHLQRILLGQQVLLPGVDGASETVFSRVVFPLLDNLLQPQIMKRDPRGMPETRLRASVLLCKVFMQLEVNDEAKEKEIRELWMSILDLLDRLMNADRRDQLFEAIPESLKNVVLVMNAMDILVPPAPEDKRTKRQKELWDVTHERIERFLPRFLDEVIPSPPPPPPTAAAPPTTALAPAIPAPEAATPSEPSAQA
ncbi:Sec7-domain-containing protein [Fomitiporia mediterranea MF3/22]|uniref:Sec7-domain-containing protein n=1 Tax=Fomitiporia mediterranea (strain MF3/22) TaxID=694068 RepID=UPI0004407298|nr:Sec7-domain-containing protein [Fomitiporia mediterranea MF3/22]EJD05730.1 Sec7-domain-containing protein [Fomitiporia mediterranea MF3/22]